MCPTDDDSTVEVFRYRKICKMIRVVSQRLSTSALSDAIACNKMVIIYARPIARIKQFYIVQNKQTGALMSLKTCS